MNIFAGNFSLKEKIKTPDLDFDIIQTGERSYFIMWADESLICSKDVVNFLGKEFWELSTHDISVQWEDELEIISSEYEIWAYECVSFEGPELDFYDILERFAESNEAISIREAGESKIYGNRLVKVDFMY